MANTQTTNTNTQFKPPIQSPATDPRNFDIDELDKRLKMAQLLKLEKQLAEEAEAERQQEASRKSGIDAVWSKIKNEKLTQDNCAHLKENGHTHLAGQKDHSGIINLVCQRCQKPFKGNQIPHHLFPSREGAIGGPSA